MHVLLVDDDPVDRKLVRRLLRDVGLPVELTEVEDLAAAESALDSSERDFDCILLDMNLPDGDGASLLERLREQGGAPAPIVVLTYHDEVERASRCLQLGAQDYLVKGRLEADALGRAIRHARERFLLTEELSEKNARLQSSNQELERFAYVASHDLQEPLRSMRMFAQRLDEKHRANLGRDGAELVDRIVDAAQRMRELINDLLELSRVSQAEEPSERVDLGTLFARVREDLSGVLAESGGRMELPEHAPTVRGDAAQLGRLFVNLIGNSLKFRHPERPPVVTISARPLKRGEKGGSGIRLQGSRVEVRLEDNGIGFDQEQAERIFRPFQRLQPRTRYPGTGIGLAICRAIVERHGGRIRAEGRPDQGAAMVVILPAAEGSGQINPGGAAARAS